MRKNVILSILKEIFAPERFALSLFLKSEQSPEREEEDTPFPDLSPTKKYVPFEAHVLLFVARACLLLEFLYYFGYCLGAPFLKPFVFPQANGIIPLDPPRPNATAEWSFFLSCGSIPRAMPDVERDCNAVFTLKIPFESPNANAVLYVNVTVPPTANLPLKNETVALSTDAPNHPNVTSTIKNGYYEATFAFSPDPLQQVKAFSRSRTLTYFAMKDVTPVTLKENLVGTRVMRVINFFLWASIAASFILITGSFGSKRLGRPMRDEEYLPLETIHNS